MRELRIFAFAKTIFQQKFGNEYFWYPKVFTAGLTGIAWGFPRTLKSQEYSQN